MCEGLTAEQWGRVYCEFVVDAPGSIQFAGLAALGWRGSAFNQLRATLNAELPELVLTSVPNISALGDAVGVAADSEYIVYTNNKKNQFTGLLAHIRNAFAHGNFRVDVESGHPVLEIWDSYRGNINMQGRIRIDTLFRLKDVIAAGPGGE
jgi:hypothetical protein